MRKHLAIIATLAFGFSAAAQGQDLKLTSDGKVPGQPFQALQQQIDALEEQIAQIQSQPVFQFAGFTIATTDGGPGILAMHDLCRAEFGPEARMCESKEFILSPNAMAPTAFRAWLHPTLVDDQRDYAGFTGRSCGGWNTVDPNTGGLTINKFGRLEDRPCQSVLPVTCCAPAASP
jgi:hypothetical protein